MKLVERGYTSDPVKSWKESQKSNAVEEDTDDTRSEVSSTSSTAGPDFAYLLNMALLSLSKEKKDELLKQRDDKVTSFSLSKRLFSHSKTFCSTLRPLDVVLYRRIIKHSSDSETSNSRASVTLNNGCSKHQFVCSRGMLSGFLTGSKPVIYLWMVLFCQYQILSV